MEQSTIIPTHLEDVEVAYELELRKVDPKQFNDRDTAINALVDALQREAIGETTAPTINLHRDSKELEEIYREVAKIIKTAENPISISHKESLIQRLTHYQKRLFRIKSSIPEVIDNVAEYSNMISNIIQDWNNDLKTTTENNQNNQRVQSSQTPRPTAENSSRAPPTNSNVRPVQPLRSNNRPINPTNSTNSHRDSLPREAPSNQREQQALFRQFLSFMEAIPSRNRHRPLENQNQNQQRYAWPSNPVQQNPPPQPSRSGQTNEESLALYTEFLRFLETNRGRTVANTAAAVPNQILPQENNGRKKNPVKKWNVKFSGDSTGLGLKQFLNRVQFLAGREEMQLQEVLKDIHFLLSGPAETWYFQRGARIVNWNQFCEEIVARFLDPNHDQNTKRLLLECKQSDNEEFSKFLERFERIELDLERPLEDQEKLVILKANLNFTYADKLITRDFNNLNNFMAVCRNLQTHFKALKARQFFSRPRQENPQQQQSHNQQPNDQNSRPSYNSNNANNNRSTQNPLTSTNSQRNGQYSRNNTSFTCFNCGQEGHRYSNCTSPLKLFCRRCGCPDVQTSNCNECRTKNR